MDLISLMHIEKLRIRIEEVNKAIIHWTKQIFDKFLLDETLCTSLAYPLLRKVICFVLNLHILSLRVGFMYFFQGFVYG